MTAWRVTKDENHKWSFCDSLTTALVSSLSGFVRTLLRSIGVLYLALKQNETRHWRKRRPEILVWFGLTNLKFLLENFSTVTSFGLKAQQVRDTAQHMVLTLLSLESGTINNRNHSYWQNHRPASEQIFSIMNNKRTMKTSIPRVFQSTTLSHWCFTPLRGCQRFSDRLKLSPFERINIQLTIDIYWTKWKPN